MGRGKRGAALIGILFIVSSLGACGGNNKKPPSEAARQTTPVAVLAAKQELTVGVGEDQYTTNGDMANLSQYVHNLGVTEPLVRLTEDLGVEPLLATRWEYRGNNTWRFFLRQGVTFHDGQPFNATAVLPTMARIARGGGTQTLGLGPDSAKVIDDYTVEITPTLPNLRVVEQLAHPLNGIIAPGTELGQKPVGTGPFKSVEYQKGQQVSVVRNDAYWGDKAKLEKVTFRFMPDANTRLLALEAGEVDMIFDLPREAVSTVKQKKGFTVADAPVGQTLLLYVNSHGKPGFDLLSDKTLRRALAMTLDRETIVTKVLEGTAKLNPAMAPQSILGEFAGRVQGIVHDPSAAAKLLDDAGWRKGSDGIRVKDGRPLSLTLVSWPTIDRSVLEFAQAKWRENGIDVKLVNSPDFPSYQQFINNSFEFDLDAELPNQNDANPIFLPALRVYTKATAKSAPLFAPGGEADRVIEQGLSATDPKGVQENAAEAMRLLIDDEAAVIPIAGYFRIYAMKDKIQGFVPNPSQTSQPLNRIFIAK